MPSDAEPRWMGYSTGRWEGDTFVVSAGFDERSWIQENRVDRRFGYPHSDAVRLEERYRRISPVKLQLTVTVEDAKTLTAPWVTNATIDLMPSTELWEYFCVPSEADAHRKSVREPATGVTR